LSALLRTLSAGRAGACSGQGGQDRLLKYPRLSPRFAPYYAPFVPAAQLDNSRRLEDLIVDGKLTLTLDDAIALTLENNLHIAVARYDLPIAQTDLLRAKAGGATRGVAGSPQSTTLFAGSLGGGVGGSARVGDVGAEVSSGCH